MPREMCQIYQSLCGNLTNSAQFVLFSPSQKPSLLINLPCKCSPAMRWHKKEKFVQHTYQDVTNLLGRGQHFAKFVVACTIFPIYYCAEFITLCTPLFWHKKVSNFGTKNKCATFSTSVAFNAINKKMGRGLGQGFFEPLAVRQVYYNLIMADKCNCVGLQLYMSMTYIRYN